MIEFYNAFISYKHAKLDSAIAEHVQRKLEHFHVPHKLKKKLKHTKITRIFRDKDELPITSDLTETITQALKNAEYLIVICSTNTKESYWVKREINTFLQTHTADKILTVLCDGEPFDVIPEELLSMEKEYQDENGITHRVKVPVEPLSCDYRLKRSTADKEELPRLASALLGCSYDELQRRNRQYRIRRVAAAAGLAFAAVVAFGCYMAYTSKQINDNYIESLRGRSRYLATESEQLLNEGKRTDAIQLSLAALPDGPDDKMPVTAQAVRAITYTTSAYKANSGASFVPVWNYKTTHPVTKTIITEDRFHLAAMDKSSDIYCWDTSSHELVFEKGGNNDQVDVLFPDNESILIVYEDHLEAYNIKSGSMMWKFQSLDEFPIRAGDIQCTSRSVIIDNGDGSVSELSLRDGSVRNVYQLNNSFLPSIYHLTLSPDGKKIAFTDAPMALGSENLYIYDTETGKLSTNTFESYILWSMKFTDDDHVCIMTTKDFLADSVSYSQEMKIKQTGYMDVLCFDSSAKQVWAKEMAYNDVASGINSMYLPTRDAVLVYAGDAALIIDQKTGTEQNNYQTGSSIITCSDRNGDGLPEFVCKHGEYIFALNETNDNLAVFNVLCDNITTGIANDLVYAVQQGSEDIICYTRYLEDEDFTEIDAYGGFTTGSSFQTCYDDDEYLIIAARVDETEDVRVSVIDINTGSLLFSEDVNAPDGLLSNFSVEKIDDTIYGIFGYSIYEIDPDKEKVKKVDVEIDYGNDVSNGKIITVDYTSRSSIEAEVTDLDGKNSIQIKSKEIEDLNLFDLGQPVYVRELDSVFFPFGNRLFVSNLSSGKIKELKVPDNWNVGTGLDLYVTVSEDGSRVLMSDGNILLVLDKDLKEQYTIRCNYTYRYNAVFKNDVLYVVADGYLSLYDGKTGELMAKYEMTLYGIGDSDLSFDDANHRLYFRTGDQISVFDTETWVEIACIKNAYCYHAGTDRFYVYSYMTSIECTPGYFKQLSLEELIEKAHKILGNQELPVEIRSRYGL